MANPYKQGLSVKRAQKNEPSHRERGSNSQANDSVQRVRGGHPASQGPSRTSSARDLRSRKSRSPDISQMSENIQSRGCSPSRRPSTASNRLARNSSVSPSRLPPTMTNPEGRGRKLPATPIRQPNLPSKRLELTLNKFTTVALPLHLNVINQHTANIERLQKLNDWNGIRFEVDVSTNAVHALGALLFEMEVIRGYLEPHELPYFDATLAPAQNSSIKALNRLQGLCPTNVIESSRKNGEKQLFSKNKNKWMPNGMHSNTGRNSSSNMSNQCSSSVGDLTSAPLKNIECNGPASKYSSLSSQNVAVVSLSNESNSPPYTKRFPGSCNDITDFDNSNFCYPPPYNQINSQSSRFNFQKSVPMISDQMSESKSEGVGKSESNRFLTLPYSNSNLTPTSSTPFNKQYSPRPSKPAPAHSFVFPNPQSTSNNVQVAISIHEEKTYLPPSPLELWKIGRADASENKDVVNGDSECHTSAEDCHDHVKYGTSSNSKDANSSVVHSSKFTSTTQQPSSTTVQSLTPKKRGQTVGHHIGGSGGTTLEVLYEDPKEDLQSDVLSILSCSEINDDDKRKLIEEMASGNNADDGGNTRSNINVKLNTKNIFSRFTSPGTTDTNGSNENYNNLKNEGIEQKTEDEIILESSWIKLDEEIRDVHLLIEEFYHADCKNKGPSYITNGRNHEYARDISTSAIYPVAGALLGTCLGGPVGLLAGVKIGGLAAIGGSVFGYSTGSIIKQQKERQDYIDDFYASHSPSIVLALSAQAGDSNGTSAKLNNLSQLKKEQWSSQRTHSLPDVLSAKQTDENGERSPAAGAAARVNTRNPRSTLSRNNSGSKKNYHVRFDLIAEDAKNYHRPSLPNHVAGLRRAQSARRNVTRSTDNLLY